MFRKGGSLNNLKISINDWGHIQSASFPNSANILFKYYIKRERSKTNRFNSSKGTKHTTFKKGHTQYSAYIPPEADKPYWIYSGKWKPWPKKEREALKEKIILALSLNGNCRKKAAEVLGYSRRHFYKILDNKFVEINWSKDYPSPKKFAVPHLHNPKRVKKMKESWLLKAKKYRSTYVNKVIELRNSGNSLHAISQELKICRNTVKKCIKDYEEQQ